MHFVNLFVYGTLLSPEVRETVFGRPVPYMQPDTISGFEIKGVSIDNFSYPALIRNKTSMVHGGIILIHEDELRLLDEYETDSYGRIFTRLMSGKEAWVYAKKEEIIIEEPMEEKVLYNVLCQIARKQPTTAAPDEQYVRALITIGMVKDGWDMELTLLGISTMNRLADKLNPW